MYTAVAGTVVAAAAAAAVESEDSSWLSKPNDSNEIRRRPTRAERGELQ